MRRFVEVVAYEDETRYVRQNRYKKTARIYQRLRLASERLIGVLWRVACGMVAQWLVVFKGQRIYAPEAAWKINAPTSVASMTLTVTLVWPPDPLDKPSKLESIPVKNVA